MLVGDGVGGVYVVEVVVDGAGRLIEGMGLESKWDGE